MAKRFIKCPSCSTAMGIGEDKIGQKIKCPSCRSSFNSKWKRKPLHLILKDSSNKIGWIAVGVLLMFLVGQGVHNNRLSSASVSPVSFNKVDDFGSYLIPNSKPKLNLQKIPRPSLDDENIDGDGEFNDRFNNDEFNDEFNHKFLRKGKIPVAQQGKIPVVEIGWRRRQCSNTCPTVCPTVTATEVKNDWILHHTNSYYKYIFPPQFVADTKFVVDSQFEEELYYTNKFYKVWIFNGLAPRISDSTRDGVRYVVYDYATGIELTKCQSSKAVLALGSPEKEINANTSEIVTPVKSKLRKPSEFPQ